MGITRKAWINYRDTHKPELKDPIAIVGSPGLRSVGKIAVDTLIEKLQTHLFAELFSYGFPGTYYGPSYLEVPSHAGVLIAKNNAVELPHVSIHVVQKETQKSGSDVVLISGYQSYDALNHYLVADKLTDLLTELHITLVISLGAQVIEEGIRCCATDGALLNEMSRYGVEKTNVDRFIGFSGLVAALAGMKGIKTVCLFANTTQNLADPEYPDVHAANKLLEKVGEIAELKIDTSDLEEKRRSERKFIDESIQSEMEESRVKERKPEYLDGYA